MAELSESAPVALLATDGDDVITEVNLAASTLIGADAHALRGTPLGSILPDVPREPQATGVLRRRDGSRVAVDVRRASTGAGHVVVVTEAAERFEVDAALRARRQLLDAAAEAAELTAVLDRGGYVVDASGPLAEDAEGRSLIGRHWRDFVHPEDVAAVAEGLSRLAVEGPDMRTIEVRILNDTGRHDWVEALAYVNRAEDGSPSSYGVLMRDITERRRREQALRKSERQLEDAFEWSAAGLTIGDGGGLVRFNRALVDLLGRPAEEILGHDLIEFTHPDDRELTVAARDAEHPMQYEKRYVRPDGSVVWGLVGGTAVRDDDGEILHHVGSIVDITARKQTEEELGRRAAQQAAVVDLGHEALAGVTGDALFDASLAAVVEHLHVDHAVLLEVSPHEPGLKVRRILGWEGEGAFPVLMAVSQAAYTVEVGHTVVCDELHEERRFTPSPLLLDQGIRSSVMAPIHVDGRPCGVLGAHAQTPARFSEDDVMFVQGVAAVVGSAVAREIHEATAEWAHQQDRLAVVGQMAAGLAHDFNNVLTVVKLHAELLSRQAGLTEEGRHQAGIISDQVDRAIGLVWQLLDVARRGEIRVEVMDLSNFVRQLVPVVEATMGREREVLVEVPDAPAFILADLSRLNQIVLNLVANARDAVPPGGRLTLAVTSEERGGMPGHVLEVRDTGPGMTAEVERRAFDPFFSTKGPGKGTGLGLAQVRALVDQHGGVVALETGPDRGTTVRMWLSASEPGVDAAFVDPTDATVPAARAQLVLLVEDDPAVAGAVEAQLLDLGYSVVCAGHGREALDVLAQRADVEIVLSDLVMPVMDGEALARRLRTQHPDLPVVLTGAQPVRDPSLADVAWLEKPYTRDRLARLIADAVSAR